MLGSLVQLAAPGYLTKGSEPATVGLAARSWAANLPVLSNAICAEACWKKVVLVVLLANAALSDFVLVKLMRSSGIAPVR